MILHFYIARRFLGAFVTVLMALSAIFIMLDMVEHIRKFGGKVEVIEAAWLTFLNMPASMYTLLPLVVILATLFMFLGFSRSSEMVVTRAAGRPALLTLIAPAAVVFLMGVLALTLVNPIAAATSKEYKRMVAEIKGTKASVFSVSSEGFWLRQGDENGQTVIRADKTGPDGTELFGASFHSYSDDGVPTTRINAETAILEAGRWALTNAKIWDLSDLTNPERVAVENPAYWIATSLTIEQIRDSFGKPNAIAIWDMPAYIDQLKQAGFSPRRHQVWFQSELSSPFFLVAMVLIGAAFTMRHTRLGSTGIMALFALISGFGIYFIRNFANILGENGQIPVAIAAWTPPIAAMFLALGIILHLEDG